MRRLPWRPAGARSGRVAPSLACALGLFVACAGDGADTEVAATGAQTAGGAASTAKGGTAGAGTGGAGAGGAGSGSSGTGGTGGAGKGGMGGAGKGGAATGGAGAGGAGVSGSAGVGAAGEGGAGKGGAGKGGVAGSGGAGAAGSGGAAAGGVAGAGAGAGQGGEAGASANGGSAGTGPTSWKQCTLPGTCIARESYYCCFDCDISTADGVYWKHVAQHDSDVCKGKSPCGPCYPKAHFQGQRFLGVCEEGVCSAVDVRTSPLSACTTNDDCVLHHAGCCPSCIPDLSRLIALAKDGVDDYLAQACNPEAPETCDACAPAFPEGASAVCNAKGHCEVKNPPAVCPKEPPVEGTACAPLSVVYCDYGDGPSGCRDRFFCEKGAWKRKSQPCPATTVLTDCPADCSQTGVACSTDLALCTGADGALWGCQWGHWWCVSPASPSPCAGNPPYNGQACTEEGLECKYGGCGDALATKRACHEGVWVDQWGYCLL